MRLRKISNGVTIYDEEVSMEKAASKLLLYIYRFGSLLAGTINQQTFEENWSDICCMGDDKITFEVDDEQRIFYQFSVDENHFMANVVRMYISMAALMPIEKIIEFGPGRTMFRLALTVLLLHVLKVNTVSVSYIVEGSSFSLDEKIFSLVLDEQYRNNIERLCVNPELN